MFCLSSWLTDRQHSSESIELQSIAKTDLSKLIKLLLFAMQALPSHLQEEIEFESAQKPVFMSHILRALATWQTALNPVPDNTAV